MKEREECKNNSSCLEPSSTDSKPEVVLSFPVKGGGEYGLPKLKLNQYADTFPELGEIGVLAELKKARQWLVDNPKKLKTKRGMPSFMNGWLNNHNNGGIKHGQNGGTKQATRKADSVGRASGAGLPLL